MFYNPQVYLSQWKSMSMKTNIMYILYNINLIIIWEKLSRILVVS